MIRHIAPLTEHGVLSLESDSCVPSNSLVWWSQHLRKNKQTYCIQKDHFLTSSLQIWLDVGHENKYYDSNMAVALCYFNAYESYLAALSEEYALCICMPAL